MKYPLAIFLLTLLATPHVPANPSNPINQTPSEPDPRIVDILRKAALKDSQAILQMRQELGITTDPADFAFDESGKWTTAVKTESDRNNPVAWFLQGIWQPNTYRCVRLMEAAAEKGQAEACEAIANRLLRSNLTVTPAIARKEATRFYYMAAKGGRSSAAYMIGVMLEPTDTTTAFTWYLSAAKAGNPKATGKCAWMLAEGIGTSKNSAAARKFGEQATKRGDPTGAFTYAMTLLESTGDNPVKDRKNAIKVLEKLAENDIIPAAYWLGLCIINDSTLVEQRETGIEWLQYACSKSYAPATQVLDSLKIKHEKTQN